MEEDSSNSKKASLKRERCEVMANISQPNPEKPYMLSFSSTDSYGIMKPHANPLVITALVYNFNTRRIMVYTGSLVDVLF